MSEEDEGEPQCSAVIRFMNYHYPVYRTTHEELLAQGYEVVGPGVFEMPPMLGPFPPRKKSPWWRRARWRFDEGQSRFRQWLSNKIYNWEVDY